MQKGRSKVSSFYTGGIGPKEEQLLYRNVQWFQGGLVFKAHRRLYHSDLVDGSYAYGRTIYKHMVRIAAYRGSFPSFPWTPFAPNLEDNSEEAAA